jgi:cytochrome c oxidase subunit I+III
VLFGGAVFGILAALYYWWPKITGTLLDERLGKLQFWLTIVGFNGTFFPMHFLGAEGMPRRIYRYAPGLGWDGWNLVATVSAFVLGLAFAVLFVNIWRTLRRGKRASADPWDGRTLEWWVPSPPPVINFPRVPLVRARDAFWALKYGRRPADAGAAVPLRPALEAAPPDVIHEPAPSILPVLLGTGVLLAGLGLLTRLAVTVIGLIITLLAVVGFAFERPTFGQAEPGEPAVTAVDSRKLGLWAFVGSESIFFASLISTYLIYKAHNVSGPSAAQVLEIPLTSFSTFVLLMSSLLMVLALAAIQRGAERASRNWLLGTAGLGLVFLGGQVYEFTHFYHKGVTLQTNLFSQTFYTLVGFHGAHVTVGVIWLLALAGASLVGRLPKERCLAVELCGIYWHFVDIVWIVIFTLVYLLEGVSGA